MRCRRRTSPPQDYVWRALICKMKAHFTKQSPLEVLKQEYGDDEPTRAVLNVITKAAAVPGRYRDIGLGQPARRNVDSGFLRRAVAEFGLSGIGIAGREVLVRPCGHCQHADAGEHADDCRIVCGARCADSRCGKVRSRPSPSRRRRWR